MLSKSWVWSMVAMNSGPRPHSVDHWPSQASFSSETPSDRHPLSETCWESHRAPITVGETMDSHCLPFFFAFNHLISSLLTRCCHPPIITVHDQRSCHHYLLVYRGPLHLNPTATFEPLFPNTAATITATMPTATFESPLPSPLPFSNHPPSSPPA